MFFWSTLAPDGEAVQREDPDRLVHDVGARIAELRKAAGLTQAAFAEALGASVQYASRIELGQENLTLHSLARIANVLGVRVVDLFEPPTQVRTVKRGRPRKTRA